jgi:hypothetical protein
MECSRANLFPTAYTRSVAHSEHGNCPITLSCGILLNSTEIPGILRYAGAVREGFADVIPAKGMTEDDIGAFVGQASGSPDPMPVKLYPAAPAKEQGR